VVPIVFSELRRCFDGLKPERHFLDGLRLHTDHTAADLASVQHELYSWYASHSARVHASFLEQLLNSSKPRSHSVGRSCGESYWPAAEIRN
jgi:hypothetical protein